MSKIKWNETGERLFETGVEMEHCSYRTATELMKKACLGMDLRM